MRTRRMLFFLVVLALGVTLAGAASAAILTYRANLNAAQESGVTSPALGVARITIDTDANTLSYEITYKNLTSAETAAHIHGYAAPGATGPPVHTLPATNPKVGVWAYPGANEAQILAGLTYINIHTSNYTGGEIRGQIVAGAVPGVAPWGVGALSALVLGTGVWAVRRRRVVA